MADPDHPVHLILGPADGVDRNGRIEETHDGGRSWEGASKGLVTPWPRHMVERFHQVGDELYAVLSNGELIVSPVGKVQWREPLPDVKGVNALTAMG